MEPKLKREDQIDARADEMFNTHPDLQSREQSTGSEYANQGADQAEAYANDPQNANVNDARTKEAQSNGFYTGSKGEASNDSSRSSKFKANFKKFGPTGGIIGAIFGIFFGLGVLISPSLAIVHLKEVFTEDLNDQLAAMDTRSAVVMRAKLNDLGKGQCRLIQIRCGLRGMTEKQIENFKKAGIDVETGDRTGVTGKRSIESLEFTRSNGEKVRVRDGAQAIRLLGDSNINRQLKRAYNPKFYALWDAASGKIFDRYGTDKSKKVSGANDEERNRTLNEAVSKDDENSRVSEGDKRAVDEDDPNSDADRNYNSTIDRVNSTIDSSSGFKSVFGGVVRGVGIAGVADSACTIYNTSRLVESGAKIIRAYQLVKFAMVFLNFADEVKAGEATPEDTEYIGNKLTALDMRSTVINEKSSGDGEEVDNPYYMKSAFDSEGAKAAFHNDAPDLTAQAQQFMAGGAMVGTLSAVNDKIESLIPGGTQACGVIQNPFVRGAGLIIGGVAAIGSFGIGTGASIAGSVAISMALPLLAAYLKDMVAGDVVNANTEGVDAGNAVFSGTGVMLGDAAKQRGMQPASEGQIAEYTALQNKVEAEYIAMETEDAKKTPFDVMNQYSFLGSFARKLLPAKTSSASVSGTLLSGVPNLFKSVSTSFLPTANAVGEYNPERFKKCNDSGFKRVGIDGDIFCNVRYTMTKAELALETDDVYRYMAEDNNFVDPETGDPVGGSDYEEWVAECVDRDWGWGEESGENTGDTGERCKENDEKNQNFRVYTMDRTIEEGMDNGPQYLQGNETNAGTELRIATFNVWGAHHTRGKPENVQWKARMDRSIKTIQENNLEVVGFQELEEDQQDYIDKNLTGYERTSGGKEDNSVMWDTSRFELVDEGTWGITYASKPTQVPWARLSDIETGQNFFVMNTHDPSNFSSASSGQRTDNARKHIAKVKELQKEAPVFLTGDFNTGYVPSAFSGAPNNESLAYCILSNGGMNNAYDLAKSRDSKCPQSPEGQEVDHIYMTDEVQVSKYDKAAQGPFNNGADVHETIWADAVIPGAANGGSEFTVGTYNQKGSLSKASHLKATGIIADREMDIVGTQETTPTKYRTYKEDLSSKGYGVYPNYNGTGRTCASTYAIFYNKEKFNLVSGDYFQIPRYPDPAKNCGEGERSTTRSAESGLPKVWTNIPYVVLQDKSTGQRVIAINTHNVANVSGARGTIAPKSRAVSAQIYIDTIRDLKQKYPSTPIVMTGDFNEGYTVRTSGNSTWQNNHRNLFFCKLAETKLMKSASGPAMKCPNNGGSPIDYIYATPEIQVQWAREIGRAEAASDHNVRYARLVIPGSGNSKSFSWPFSKEHWQNNKADYLGAHGSTGTAWGGDNMGTSGKGPNVATDISSGASVGTPIHAMFDGVVTSTSLCGSGDGVAIKSTINGATLGVAYMHGSGQTVKVGDRVKAGQKIMGMNTIGCNSTGAHLHLGIAYKGNYVCPQDIFLAADKGSNFNWGELVRKGATGSCGR